MKMLQILKAGVFDSLLVFENCPVTPRRTVTEYEAEFYISGEGESYVDGKIYPHEKGNLIFSKPGQVRYTVNRFLCLYIHFVADTELKPHLDEISSFLKVSDYTLYESCFKEIIRLYESDDRGSVFLLQSKILELMDMMLTDSKVTRRMNKASTSVAPEVLYKAINFMEQNCDKPIALKDIAAAVNFSPTYFHKVFTLSVGKTPHEFLMEKRISMAKMLLLTTEDSIERIVEKTGFSSLSYFDYSFKGRVGITPSDFRKRKYKL